MEEIREKILQKRTLQKKFVQFALSVFGRALQACQQLDEQTAQALQEFPEDFVLVIGILNSRHPLILQNKKSGLRRVHESHELFCRRKLKLPSSIRPDINRCLEVRLKSVEAGWRMVTGKLSARQAYARHDLVIRGELGKAIQLLHCMELVKSYLSPKILVEKSGNIDSLSFPKRRQIFAKMLYLHKKDTKTERKRGVLNDSRLL